MEVLIASISLVTLAEMGDKTQFLSLLLAVRYRQIWPIIMGIFVAAAANHFLAVVVGHTFAAMFSHVYLQWAMAIAFIGMGIWTFISNNTNTRYDAESLVLPTFWPVFWKTTTLFFLIEMGDKAQIATMMLAIKYDALIVVLVGSTIGMLIANIPVVLLGSWFAKRMYVLNIVRYAVALIFVVMGMVFLWNT